MLQIISLPPGAQGAAITGIQGIGVKTPAAAAVAEATVGLAMLWHMPNGMIFAIGLLSIMLPAGLFCTFGRIGSITIKLEGAIPKEHWSKAPAVTNFAIRFALS